MEIYKGYTENGVAVPIGNRSLPDGLNVVITVLDDKPTTREERIAKRLKAIEKFRKGIREYEPLPPEFDEIVDRRVYFSSDSAL
jgi:hypothetical protein